MYQSGIGNPNLGPSVAGFGHYRRTNPLTLTLSRGERERIGQGSAPAAEALARKGASPHRDYGLVRAARMDCPPFKARMNMR